METNNNPREKRAPQAEDFDAKGNQRSVQILPDGTSVYMSREEYMEEMNSRGEDKNNQ